VLTNGEAIQKNKILAQISLLSLLMLSKIRTEPGIVSGSFVYLAFPVATKKDDPHCQQSHPLILSKTISATISKQHQSDF
jgi:hypothetical protein